MGPGCPSGRHRRHTLEVAGWSDVQVALDCACHDATQEPPTARGNITLKQHEP